MKIKVSYDSAISQCKQRLNQLRHLIFAAQWLSGCLSCRLAKRFQMKNSFLCSIGHTILMVS